MNRILSVILLIAMLLALCACGDNSVKQKIDKSIAEAEEQRSVGASGAGSRATDAHFARMGLR